MVSRGARSCRYLPVGYAPIIEIREIVFSTHEIGDVREFDVKRIRETRVSISAAREYSLRKLEKSVTQDHRPSYVSLIKKIDAFSRTKSPSIAPLLFARAIVVTTLYERLRNQTLAKLFESIFSFPSSIAGSIYTRGKITSFLPRGSLLQKTFCQQSSNEVSPLCSPDANYPRHPREIHGHEIASNEV